MRHLAFAATYALGKACCWYYGEKLMGHAPTREELQSVMKDQAAAARELWNKHHDKEGIRMSRWRGLLVASAFISCRSWFTWQSAAGRFGSARLLTWLWLPLPVCWGVAFLLDAEMEKALRPAGIGNRNPPALDAPRSGRLEAGRRKIEYPRKTSHPIN